MLTTPRNGNYEVHVASFPDGLNKRRVSLDEQGGHPRWQRDGRRLCYSSVGTVMSVAMEVDSSGFEIGVPEAAIEPRLMSLTDGRSNFAVTADGERFLLHRPSLDPPPTTIVEDVGRFMAVGLVGSVYGLTWFGFHRDGLRPNGMRWITAAPVLALAGTFFFLNERSSMQIVQRRRPWPCMDLASWRRCCIQGDDLEN